MADQFRVESKAFKTIPWQTDVLSTSQGLDQLNDIPELRHFLALIRERENVMWAMDSASASELRKQGLQRPRTTPAEGLKLLRKFCETGTAPSPDHIKDADLFAKELLYYRVLDVFSQVYGKGGQASMKEKLPLVLLSNLGHSNLNHWPELIYKVTTVLEKTSSRDMPVLTRHDSVGAVDPQLIHCFQTLCLTTKRIYKNNFLHNLAAAGFHLCYMLRGNLHLPKDRRSLQEELRGGGFSVEEDFSFYSEKLQTPLSVALGISPLFLLGNRMLASICMGKPKIVEFWGTLGNQRPHLVKSAENRLWRAIIDIATTSGTLLRDIVETALNDIRTNISVNLDQCEPCWFRPALPEFEVREGSLLDAPGAHLEASSVKTICPSSREEEEEASGEDEDFREATLPAVPPNTHVSSTSLSRSPSPVLHPGPSATSPIACSPSPSLTDKSGLIPLPPAPATHAASLAESCSTVDRLRGLIRTPDVADAVGISSARAAVTDRSGRNGMDHRISVNQRGSGGVEEMDIDQSGKEADLGITANRRDGRGTHVDQDGSEEDPRMDADRGGAGAMGIDQSGVDRGADVVGQGDGDKGKGRTGVVDVSQNGDLDRSFSDDPGELSSAPSDAQDGVAVRPTRKRKTPPPPEPASKGGKRTAPKKTPVRKPPPKGKPRPKSVLKQQSELPQSEQVSVLTYFEEVEIKGPQGSKLKLVEIFDLTQVLKEPTKPNFVKTIANKHEGPLVQLHSPSEVFSYQPAFHHEEDLKLFQDIYVAVMKSYIDGKPAWMTDPEHSAIRVLSRQDMENMGEEDVQDIFRTQHILVKDHFQPKLDFNEKGLKTLAELDKPITLQDHSRQNTYEEDSLHSQGTLKDLLNCEADGSKILNALDLPLTSAPPPPTAFSSDLAAFGATLDLAFCGRTIGYPAISSRWGLAATSGAFHLWHTDCDGFATYIDTQTGYKWWVIARPKEPSGFSDTSMFTNGKFAVNHPNDDVWDLEAVLLAPGSRLYMRPNTPHYVVTPKAAICHGGHFYATSTIRETVFCVFHMFSLSRSITNTEHSLDSRFLLQRLITYFHHVLVRGQFDHQSSGLPSPHIPDIRTLEGTLDLFSLCIIGELGDLLDPSAYAKRYRDRRALEQKQLSTIYTRGLARELRAWWNGLFMFREKDGIAIDGAIVFNMMFTHQVKTLAAYKKLAERRKMETEESACTGAAFESLAKRYFPCLGYTPMPEGASMQNFNWHGAGYTVSPLSVRTPVTSASPIGEILKLGALPFERELVYQYLSVLEGPGPSDHESPSSSSDEGESSEDLESRKDSNYEAAHPRKRAKVTA